MKVFDSAMFGSRIVQERKRRGLRQDEAAEQIGIGQTTLSRIERGQGGTLTSFSRIAEWLNLDIMDFFPED